MYPNSIYLSLKVVSILVLWGQSIYYLDTWILWGFGAFGFGVSGFGVEGLGGFLVVKGPFSDLRCLFYIGFVSRLENPSVSCGV